jgi:hypothetical protein
MAPCAIVVPEQAVGQETPRLNFELNPLGSVEER